MKLFILLLCAACMAACGHRSAQKTDDTIPVQDDAMLLTAKDTAAVLQLTGSFMTAVKEKRYADAVQMLHTLKAGDSFAIPEQLDNEQIAEAMESVRKWPVHDFEITDIDFKDAYDNSVRCKVILTPKADNQSTQAISMIWNFKPVRYWGEWKLCLRSSSQGDRTFTPAR